MLNRLSSPRLFYVLFVLNFLVSLGIFISFIDFTVKGDVITYMALAKSIVHGHYSIWDAILPVYIPDTLRPPGYPLFLSMFLWMPGYFRAIQITQFIIYLFSIWMCTRLIAKFDQTFLARNLFLLLLLPCIQVPYYATQILPESTVGAALVGFALLYYNERKTIFTYILSGLLWLYIFECRPVFLLFPVIFFAITWLHKKSEINWKKWIISITVFFAGTLPYGVWNLKHHGVFRITPLEGGGSIIMAGYWQYKLPNVTSNVAAGFVFDDELISNHDPAQIQKDSARFAADFQTILKKVEPLMTPTDRLYNDTMVELGRRGQCATYSGAYTTEREKLYLQNAVKYISGDMGYWLMTRPFNIVRLFVTNIAIEVWQLPGIKNKLKAIYPTMVTGLLLLLFLSCFFFNLKMKTKLWLVYLICFYYWLIYFPFASQSRYSLPIHLLTMVSIGVVLSARFQQKSNAEIKPG